MMFSCNLLLAMSRFLLSRRFEFGKREFAHGILAMYNLHSPIFRSIFLVDFLWSKVCKKHEILDDVGIKPQTIHKKNSCVML
jgi:hypothetical protein